MKQHNVDLDELLKLRLDSVNNLYKIEKDLHETKGLIEREELEINISFNRRVDPKDSMYSNAEKRKAALKNELLEDTTLVKARGELDKLELLLQEAELEDKRLKLMEKYLFKKIELLKG